MKNQNGTKSTHGRKWEDFEIRMLRVLYPDVSSRELAEFLGRTASSVQTKAKELGIRKSQDFYRTQGKKFANHPKAVAHRFKKKGILGALAGILNTAKRLIKL